MGFINLTQVQLDEIISAINNRVTSDKVNVKVDKIPNKGLSTNDFTNFDKSKLDGIENGAEVNLVDSVAGKTGVVTLVKGDVGLGFVDNTSDLNKPISTAVQAALSLLSNVDNTSDLNKPVSIATQQVFDMIRTSISNVDNTSDLNKPISTVTQIELDKKVTIAQLDLKSDKSVTYTKTEVDDLILNSKSLGINRIERSIGEGISGQTDVYNIILTDGRVFSFESTQVECDKTRKLEKKIKMMKFGIL